MIILETTKRIVSVAEGPVHGCGFMSGSEERRVMQNRKCLYNIMIAIRGFHNYILLPIELKILCCTTEWTCMPSQLKTSDGVIFVLWLTTSLIEPPIKNIETKHILYNFYTKGTIRYRRIYCLTPKYFKLHGGSYSFIQ